MTDSSQQIGHRLNAEARRLVEESCAAQGLEPTITDPVVLGKVAAILKGGDRQGRRVADGRRVITVTGTLRAVA